MPGATELDLTAGKSPQEALQALIQAEIKRQGAVDFANRTLGPIAEEFLRIVETDGSARYQVIDGIGELRTYGSSSDALPFTIADLVAELRTRHPTLFEPLATNASGRVAPKPLPKTQGSRAAASRPRGGRMHSRPPISLFHFVNGASYRALASFSQPSALAGLPASKLQTRLISSKSTPPDKCLPACERSSPLGRPRVGHTRRSRVAKAVRHLLSSGST